ncbi:hypothetical protein DAPPUDRAFT_323225 [Daphnia pulex]|uniref:Peptidase S1 domain-containing protein n=1 Tax=Daphnia pulex TaxID=6669 RepID=E9GY90_DAPPU|nr:hypothetical protein DAPPUDRAFT_323225 [Daphnia pulex]|eukprot:EFX75604.1 hypothetical protein DAPPUDRAFT_323225 [Daphnia pulex]
MINNRFTFLLLLAITYCSRPVSARIYQTIDAIIVEADEIVNRTVRSAVYDSSEVDLSSVDFSYPTSDQLALPSRTSLLSERACRTVDGNLGTCGSIRDCYPGIRMPESKNVEKWIINSSGGCSYAKSNGKELFGLCCSRQTTIRANTTTTNATASTSTTNSTINIPVIPVVDIDPATGLPVASFPWWQYFPYNPLTTTTTPQPTTTTTTTTTPPPTTTAGLSTLCGTNGIPTVPIDPLTGQPDPNFPWWLCFPYWLVAILNNGKQFCGGSLIDKIHILTAAHCVAHLSSWDIPRLEVVLGMHTLKPRIDPQAIRKRVLRVTRHKGFDSKTLYNDIAIITLVSPVAYGPTISPICLPTTSFYTSYAGKEAVVVGWGSLKEGGIQPNVLQQVTVRVKTNAECKKNYGIDAPGGIANHMLCAGTAGKDACSGDSGGPLVIQSARGAPWVQAGIVSWGIGCGQAPYPGVYTRTASFMNWIRTNAQFEDEERRSVVAFFY